MNRGTACLVASLVAVAAACDGIDANAGQVGSTAPEYAAVTLDGETARLSDLEGTVVLLNVWATWCAPCREEIPALQALYEGNADRGFEVVGVSVDGRGDTESIRRFATEFGMTYRIWHDPEDVVGRTFRTIGVPATFLVDREGIVRWRHMGPVEPTDPGLVSALEGALAGG